MSRFCKNCGTPLTGDEVFCKGCGAKVDIIEQTSGNTAAPVPPQPVYTPPAGATYTQAAPKKSKLGLILGIVGGVVAISAVVLVLFLTGVLGGKVDISDIEGKWYSSDTMIDFDDDGTLRIVTDEETIRGEFTYDTDKKEGIISSDARDYDDIAFARERDTLVVDDVEYYRDKEEAGYGEDTAQTGDVSDDTQTDDELAQQIVGLWHAVETTYEGQSQDVSAMGMAFEFAADGSVTEYEGFAISETGTWDILLGSSLQLIASDGDMLTFENIVMVPGGAGFTADVTADDGTGSISFEKADAATFGGSGDLMTQLQGFWMICGSNMYPPVNNDVIGWGMAIAFDGMTMDFYAEFDVDTLAIDYEFVDADTIHYFEDGSDYTVNIAFKTLDGREYLVMGNDAETLYLLPSTYDEFMAAASTSTTSGGDTQYTSDADIRALLTREWNAIYRQYVDGSQDVDVYQDNMVFYADGTFDEVYEGESWSGTWSVENGILTMDYGDGDSLVWPVFIEFSEDMQAYLLYSELYDDSGMGTGEYMVYSDYQP